MDIEMDTGKSPASVQSGTRSPAYSFVAPSRSVKRPRPVKSCLECRKRKLRCDRASPCSQCQKTQRICRYAAEGEVVSLSDGSDGEAPERNTKRTRPAASQESGQRDTSYEAVLEDHAVRLERLEGRLLSRTSSLAESSSIPAQRPAASSLTIRGLTVKGGLRTRFFGQSSTRVLVNLFDEAKDFMFSRNKSSDIKELFLNVQKIHKALQDEHRKVTAPITVFVDSMTPIQKRMADVLPSRTVCDTLLGIYLKGSETIYRVLHIPSFMKQYDEYWEGKPQHDAFLPQLLSILCVGYRNLNDEDIHPDIEQLPPPKPIDQDTDSRVQVFAANTLSMRFRVVDLINRTDSLQDYQQVLDLGNELERVFEDIRYMVPTTHSNDMSEVRRRWMTRVVLDMHCRRPLLALYRPFALGSTDVPQQIVTGYLRSSMVLLSYLDELDPASPDYHRIWHLHQLVLKQEILQAAFSICYYIKQATSSSASPAPSDLDSNTKVESIEEAYAVASESSLLLSLPRLKNAVQTVLDTQIKRIREIGTDLRDIVSLTVVFNTCQGGTPEQKRDAITNGLQAILDAGLQAIHANQENIASMPIMPPTVPMQMNGMQADSGFMSHMQPFMTAPDALNSLPDDFAAMWDMEFWTPVLQPGPP
ncbi:Activator of stress proteins 1 [Daldinia childiae]|uniref:Activator of stress proteins 1 n=1 Tax=Daldinia childiae TaxID=326645 RepID=UPI0014470639|nr:Activator of stress proteins 1 [Daldinia childiae]KAF3071291.1 Activator of stress proteins 1 [Daldinia childiae]